MPEPEADRHVASKNLKVNLKGSFSFGWNVPDFYLGGAVVLVSILANLPVLWGGFFCWDDNLVVLSPVLTSFNPDKLVKVFNSHQSGLYHPVTSLSFMIDHLIGGGQPVFYHLTNLLLGAACSYVVFLIMNLLTGNRNLAFVSAMIFAVHPIHVEAIAWITARKDILSTFFYLLAVKYYIDYLIRQRPLRSLIWVWIFGTLAVFSKVQAVTLPLVLLMLDYLFKREKQFSIITDKIPLLIICLIGGWLNVKAQSNYGYLDYGYTYSAGEKIVLSMYAMADYVKLVLWPLNLSVFHPFPFKPGGDIATEIFALPLLVIALFGILLYLHSKKKTFSLVLFGIMLFMLNVAVNIFVAFNRDFIVAERYAYLASTGLIIIIVITLSEILRMKQIFTALISAVIILLSFQTINYANKWNNQVNLFKHASGIYPSSDIILNTLGAREIEAGDLNSAILNLDRAIELAPDYSEAFYNRGIAFGKSEKNDPAFTDLTKAIELNDQYDEAWFARGNLLMRTNNLNDAHSDFTRTLALNPNHFGALQNRAIVRGNLNDFEGALSDINKAIAINHNQASSYYLKGIALFNTGGNGCNELKKAASMGYPDAHKALEYYCP